MDDILVDGSISEANLMADPIYYLVCEKSSRWKSTGFNN